MADESEGERDLEVLLSYLLNRQLKQTDVIEALGISRSTYYDQKERGDVTNPANLLHAAEHFGLNPLELLMRYGYVGFDDVREVWEALNERPTAPTTKGGTLYATTLSRAKVKQHFGPEI
jgi:hypothetical protein